MNKPTSKFWTFIGLPVSLVILASAYYIKVPAARAFFDAHTPIVHQLLGRFVREPDDSTTVTPLDHIPSNVVPPSGLPPGVSSGQPAKSAASPAPPLTYDLQTLARDHSVWPKQVKLKKPVTFPAVVGGKEVGKLVAPSGTEVNLLAISNGRLGLEYKGGGAWLAVEDTDLGARVPLKLP